VKEESERPGEVINETRPTTPPISFNPMNLDSLEDQRLNYMKTLLGLNLTMKKIRPIQHFTNSRKI
jgi:hypothetical protein